MRGKYIAFNEKKNKWLKKKRGISFEELSILLENEKNILDDITNPNQKKYPGQKMFVVRIMDYAYMVPYVIDKKGLKIFLKTLYPSRKATNSILKKTRYEKRQI